MNVRSFSDLADVLIQPDEDLRKSATIDEEEDYEEEFESDFEDANEESKEETAGDVSRFSIEARRTDEEDMLLQRSQSYSQIDIRRSVESEGPAGDMSVSGSDDNDEEDGADLQVRAPVAHQQIASYSTSFSPSVAAAAPTTASRATGTPQVVEISGSDVPMRVVAPPLQAAVRISQQQKKKQQQQRKSVSKEEKVAQERVTQQSPGVKAPTKTFMSVGSKVKVAAHWEVPGVSIYENGGGKNGSSSAGSQVPNKGRDADYSAQSDRDKIVLTVLDLLQTAAKKANTAKEVDMAMKGHAIRIPSVRSGVSQRQAMAATGKMYVSNVPDYDPDFEMALQFMRSNEWPSGDVGGASGGSSNGETDSSPTSSSRSSNAQKKSSPASGGRTYPSYAGANGGSGRPSTGAFNSRYYATYNVASDAPVPVRHQAAAAAEAQAQAGQGEGRHPVYGKAPSNLDLVENSPPTTNRVSSSNSSSNAAPNFNADKDLRAVNSSIENYATWLKPTYLKRHHVLKDLPSEEAGELSNKCEKLYASFLNDLVENCKKRADACNTTEEMAMLRVLAEQVTSKFAAGEPQEDLQSRMLQGAIETMPYLKRHGGNNNRDKNVGLDTSFDIHSVSSDGLRVNRDRLGGFKNKQENY